MTNQPPRLHLTNGQAHSPEQHPKSPSIVGHFIQASTTEGHALFIAPSHIATIGPVQDKAGCPILNVAGILMANGASLVVVGTPQGIAALASTIRQDQR